MDVKVTSLSRAQVRLITKWAGAIASEVIFQSVVRKHFNFDNCSSMMKSRKVEAFFTFLAAVTVTVCSSAAVVPVSEGKIFVDRLHF